MTTLLNSSAYQDVFQAFDKSNFLRTSTQERESIHFAGLEKRKQKRAIKSVK